VTGKGWRKALLTVLKVAALVFVAGLVALQVPELRYDLGSKRPTEIGGPDGLAALRREGSTFVSVSGRIDFDKAFVHQTHGLAWTYFLVEPYGARLVARTSEKVTDDEAYRRIDTFVGRLKAFDRMPFDRTIRGIFARDFSTEIPPDAWFLAKDDVPDVSAWQVGALAFAGGLWLVFFYFFFVWRRGKRGSEDVTARA
jgi:hypothetical protein